MACVKFIRSFLSQLELGQKWSYKFATCHIPHSYKFATCHMPHSKLINKLGKGIISDDSRPTSHIHRLLWREWKFNWHFAWLLKWKLSTHILSLVRYNIFPFGIISDCYTQCTEHTYLNKMTSTQLLPVVSFRLLPQNHTCEHDFRCHRFGVNVFVISRFNSKFPSIFGEIYGHLQCEHFSIL